MGMGLPDLHALKGNEMSQVFPIAGAAHAGESFSNMGLGVQLVSVPETRVYVAADGQRRRYVAGDRISRLEATMFGVVESDAVPIPEVEPLTDVELGELYARCLVAAGFVVYRETELVPGELMSIEPADQGEQLAGLLREAGYFIARSDEPSLPETSPAAESEEKADPKVKTKRDAAEQTKIDPPDANKTE